MTSTASATIFSAIDMAPRDPILGITEAFNADTNPAKINLGVGVYYDDNGKVPLLGCVRKAEALLMEQLAPRTYLPIEGLAAYDTAVQELVFGAGSAIIQDKRAVTVQAIGGTGALKIGADFLQRFAPGSSVYISDPSWENHRALFESAGFTVNTYRYYDAATRGVDFGGMLADLKAMPKGAIVLLHACCHNPTGADITSAQWDEVIAAIGAGGLIPFLDMAYQGFGSGIAEDGAVVAKFAAAGGPLLISNSFSKSFSLYGERVGALSVVGASAEEAARLLSQLKRVVRTNYSNPPVHGGKVVATVLTTPELRQLWEDELAAMRVRIKEMRNTFVQKLKEKAPAHDFEFVREQVGMFSYSGLSKQQVERLRTEHAIYAVDTGRICVAALNSKNIDRVIDAIAKVL
ncbi:amino acid aminotransferase [Massilia antarctica]|uniref:amino acid aminotransferase n=1 Tax=Massilia antarctica TaxID=2765360 RepID=UPI0006BC8166|nr:amino acid aminotransferase [Massilia sp. H27-R4]MCY0913782.1 aspartate/tyrosine/aromatic aminotransferase [Massilia sp. H27-R4]CUI04539.1 Aromatic-amino-acid aminotransferase [Janthinobacterium sp. CG23_2]CUU28325.1 Aromatic-amino-acid aminotransferase [Janthinobacterium sp. CG23_2]